MYINLSTGLSQRRSVQNNDNYTFELCGDTLEYESESHSILATLLNEEDLKGSISPLCYRDGKILISDYNLVPKWCKATLNIDTTNRVILEMRSLDLYISLYNLMYGLPKPTVRGSSNGLKLLE